MPRLEDLPDELSNALRGMRGPAFDNTPCVKGPPLAKRRIAIVTTAGIHRLTDRPFSLGSADFRVLPRDNMNELVSTHVSPNFDRTGFAEDLNVVLPLDRLQELADSGVIGSVARYHYSFMGAAVIDQMEPAARELASQLHADKVDGVLLVPV
jgi:D-proline reductase (dithiol) PrdB